MWVWSTFPKSTNVRSGPKAEALEADGEDFYSNVTLFAHRMPCMSSIQQRQTTARKVWQKSDLYQKLTNISEASEMTTEAAEL